MTGGLAVVRLATQVGVERGIQRTEHRDTEIMSRDRAGETGGGVDIVTPKVICIVITQVGGVVTTGRAGTETKDTHPLAGQEAGVVTGRVLTMQVTLTTATTGMAIVGVTTDRVGTDISF